MQLELPVKFDNPKVALTLHSLYHALLKAWLLAWPLAFPGGMFILKYWATDSGIVTRIRVFFRHVREYAYSYARPHPGLNLYKQYRSSEEEQEYWRSSERLRKALGPPDASSDNIPLVRYFTPRLLPTYRDAAAEDPEAAEVCLSPKAFCKWHRMVFSGPMHPTLKEAREQIKYYSSRDRKEMQRISRLVSDEEVFKRKKLWTTRYSKMWKDWLNAKGPDVAIVFE